MGLFGWFLYTLGPSLNLIRDETGISRTLSSAFTIASAVGGVVAGLLVAVIVRRFGRGVLLRGGSILLMAGVLLYISGAPVAVIVFGPLLSSAAGAGCVVGVSAYLTARQKGAADAAITESNAMAALFGIVAPLLLAVAATWLGGWRISLLLLVVCLVILEIVRGRSLAPYRLDDVPTLSEGGRAAPLPRLFGWAALTIVATSAIEFSFILWSPDLLEERGGLGSAAAGAGLSAILVGVLVGRLVGARLVERLSTDRVLAGSLVVTSLGFMMVWLVPSAVVMLAGMALTGLGISVQFPLGMSRAMRASNGQTDRAGGIASAAVGASGAVAPFALALSADAWGVHVAFLIVPAMIVLALTTVLLRPVPDAATA